MGEHTGRAGVLFLGFLSVIGASFSPSFAEDNIDQTSSLRDGLSLLSAGGSFQLAFINLGVPAKRYLCISFNRGNEKPVVWVANREAPLNGSDGILRFGEDGNLVLLDRVGKIAWSTNLYLSTGGNRVARLLESGNLVISDAGGVLWESFDEPGNTLLPGMKLSINTKTGASRHLTSWKADDDPSPGKYSYRLEVKHLPTLVLLEGSKLIFSPGFWNGVGFAGSPGHNANSYFNSSIVSSGDEVSYSDNLIAGTSSLRLVLTPSGPLKRYVWNDKADNWTLMWTVGADCDTYGLCGPYGSCSASDYPICQCLSGFRPRSPEEWQQGNWTGGCVRNTALSCRGGDGFQAVEKVKLPALLNATVTTNMSLEDCRARCANNCSCTAYGSGNISQGGRACVTWDGDLVDIMRFSSSGQVFFLRVADASGAPTASDFRSKKSKRNAAIFASVGSGTAMVLLLLGGMWMKKKMAGSTLNGKTMKPREISDGDASELPFFDFQKVAAGTRNFANDHKIGEGGFGTVYKGTLEDGRDIAVKRLSHTSAQGVREFKNEVKLMVNLQHKNLVRMLGCCVRDDEKMLIYEYMPNKSLDKFIFDEIKRGELGWRMRLDIIVGIARGLQYLHHDSRFRIIHRDLKAGNILLDGAMNPKISDFGTARIFGSDQLTENTRRIVGTYGYMSPEYAINGIISTKSDVFSFGVLVLEILSGIKSRIIYGQTESQVNLVSHVWKLWQEGRCLELLDPLVMTSCPETELLRCIQVGLLCVQESPSDRPTMYAVVTMLTGESFLLPEPERPGFLLLQRPEKSSFTTNEPFSSNEITLTVIDGR